MGSDDSLGESGTPEGEGNKGEISGDKAGDEDSGAGVPGKTAGAAEIEEIFVANEEEEYAMKTMNIAMKDTKEAIINDDMVINLVQNSRTSINVCLSLGKEKGMEIE